MEFKNLSSNLNSATSSLLGPAARYNYFGSGGETSPSSPGFLSRCFGCFSFEFYQQFFDVDTNDVGFKLVSVFTPWRSMSPPKSAAYTVPSQLSDDNTSYANDPRMSQSFYKLMRAKTDLYGPFWISTTLALLVAVCSFLGKYFATFNFNDPTTSSIDLDSKENNFPKELALAVSTVYGYALLTPFLAYLYIHYILTDKAAANELKSAHEMIDNLELDDGNAGKGDEIAFKNLKSLSLIDTLCLFGYSFLPFLPAVLVAAVPIRSVEYLAMLFGLGCSSAFLISALRHVSLYADKRALFIDAGVDHLEALELELGGLEKLVEELDQIPAKRNFPIFTVATLAIGHIIFALTLKLRFFSNAK